MLLNIKPERQRLRVDVCVVCLYLDIQVVQVESQQMGNSFDRPLSLVVLPGAQPRLNVLHSIITHIMSDNTVLQSYSRESFTANGHLANPIVLFN